MRTILIIILFILISSYTGLFIRAQMEGIKISKHLKDIFLFPFYIIILPIYLIVLPCVIWNILKEDKKIQVKTNILILLLFTYAVYKVLFTSIVYKFEGVVSVFFIQLKYNEKYYKKKFKSGVVNSFAKYIGIELAGDKLIKKYGII